MAVSENDPDIDELDREQPTYDTEEPPECWGEFEFSHVYQMEWPFNLSYHDTPELSYKGHVSRKTNRQTKKQTNRRTHLQNFICIYLYYQFTCF